MEKKKDNPTKIIWLTVLLIFLSEAALGIWLGYYRGILLGDAVSRTANAFYVFFIEPHKYSSIGLVWNPLPSTLQLPIIFLAKLWRPIASKGIGAALVTAFFAALESKVLLNTFMAFKVNKKYSFFVTLLFSFHPYILFYGANGMSENISFALTIIVVCSLTLWMKFGDSSYLVQIAFSIMLMFFTRYEAIPYAAATGLCIILFICFSNREKQFWKPGGGFKECYFYIEGTMLLVFLPLTYAVFLWLLFNWIISGNPFYFANSGYSMSAYSDYYSDYGHGTALFQYVWDRVKAFTPLFFSLLFTRLVTRKIKRIDSVIFLIQALTLLFFQYLMHARGSSGGYVRYLCYIFPICMAWLPYEIASTRKKWKPFVMSVYAVTLIGSCLYFNRAFKYSEIIREDAMLLIPEGSEQMAEYINENLEDQVLLMDSYRTYDIILNIENTSRIITSCSDNFYDCIADPASRGIEYIIVPESGSYGNMDALNIAYPGIYDGAYDWCELTASYGEYKLFAVKG